MDVGHRTRNAGHCAHRHARLFVGELGWELHLPDEDLGQLYQAIVDAGQGLGLADFGSYALNAMRIEKGYHGWGADFGTEVHALRCRARALRGFRQGRLHRPRGSAQAK